ncbi:MAG TPA: hypothetical protein VKR52_19540 [Terracidiphilus sp.]|nr:hypothetical protein [Terracidiphilus sp.]
MKLFLLAAAVTVWALPGQQAASPGQQAPAPAPQAATTQSAGALDGKWHFVLDTPGGDREMDAEFAVDADGKVTGKFNDTAVAGTYKDGQMNLEFTMTSEESGETAPLKLTGKLGDDNALSGDWAFSSYNGTFKASRPKS